MGEALIEPSNGAMYMLSWEQFSHYWGDIELNLKDTDFHDFYTDEWLFNGVLNREIQVFVLSDGAIRIIFFTQVINYPKNRAIRCFWGYGCELEKFLAVANERLDDMARLMKADRVELVGRPGWFRYLRRKLPGIHEGWCTVWREVGSVRSH
jgi:hypothetical protein